MTVETATYISSLNSSNPGSSDLKAEGDDHIRLIKSTVKASFPNITGAMTATHTALNTVTNLSAGTFPTVAVTGVTDLTTTGNTILGDATADTLNVGSGGIVKDSSGNTSMAGTLLVGSSATAASRSVTVASASGAYDTGFAASINTYSAFGVGINKSGSSNAYGAPDQSSYLSSTGAIPLSIYTSAVARMTFAAATADITAQGVAISRVKAATTGRTINVTPADDAHLVAPLTTGSWAFDVWVPVWGTTSGAQGFLAGMAFSGTASSSAWSFTGFQNGAATSATNTAFGVQVATATITTGSSITTAGWFRFTGTLIVTVAGNLSLQWSQNSSSANSTNVGIGGWMNCTKVG